MQKVWLGIDFSGNRKQWKARTKRSNIWIATLHQNNDGVKLTSLIRPQEFPGNQDPFERLCNHLRTTDFDAAGIDAPFSIPIEYLPKGGRSELLQAAKSQADQTPPFPSAKWLVQYAAEVRPLVEKKPYRAAERACKVNVRSTLWAGPRGGAAFTAACLTLIGKSGRPCWPWVKGGSGILVEAFPAIQLKMWNLPHQNYGKPEYSGTREEILSSIERRFAVNISDEHRRDMIASPDALDALICCFAARAVGMNKLETELQHQADGCIAIHD